MKFIIISALAITTFMLTACQTMNDYALMGGNKQNLDKGTSYILNDNVDLDKNVETTPAALKPKYEIQGQYQVENQWSRYLRWDIKKVNIYVKDGSVIADLYGKNQNQPFYGFKVNNCFSQDFKPSYGQENVAILTQHIIKDKIKKSNGLLTDAKFCGYYKNFSGVIEIYEVKKGYQYIVYGKSNFTEWDKKTNFIAPFDGYIIKLSDKKIKSGWQDQGSAEITVFTKKVK
ncbi:hypothetical protein RFI36_15285 [Acinetobacter gerneri]|uniref:Lipoprotein n=1 Tax=Acinetobacter gerneri TaxID=202952 RepID=A0AAW8JJP2_9GAMM|nr:hypothetical protein [Acinetobacter gerneri]MDQ9011067.1 hypothetical protein [Acinetobacter gerneri]MDQ9015241.1 hypothetical protein [Acinetobacter gerneri]MDQ9026374.1 hypothetical protein [Acinetobacter gerneri]MDQ9053693.1 hypothetical protein [Acinetobacter gerneri]MDQ9061274.1 hypothetical protein [Acinetobacter gerneri]